MQQVRTMRPKDYRFATDLANTMDWNMAPEDFQFMASLEPNGCFVAWEGGHRVGVATCISYGEVGWFGNLIVKEESRNHGTGSLLVSHAINYLRDKGVETIGLYAYPNLKHFYNKRGFQHDKDFSVLHAETTRQFPPPEMPNVDSHNISEIASFDCSCFGANRQRLLQSIVLEEGNLSYCLTDRGETIGYIASTVYESMAWLGPLVCKENSFDAAVSLLKAALARLEGKSAFAVTAKNENALNSMLFRVGFREDFYVSRMFLGSAKGKNCIYMAESLERG